MPKLALLDGHSLAYRAFYALPADLATTAGQVTNAVFGFTSMLIKLLGDERPDAVAVAWDVRGPTFRSEEYPEYKAQRTSPPDLFRGQLPLIRDVLNALKITQIGVAGVEADDVIATLASQARDSGWDTVIVTGDRDAFQLVEPAVTVLYTRRGITDTVRADAAWLEQRYGVTPAQYVEYAALRGDPSDNLPGVPGVGEKTAAKLIAAYGSLEAIFENIADHTPKLRENLEASKEQVFLNQKLMTLVRDVPFSDGEDDRIRVEALTLREWDRDEVRTVFDDLAFRALWDRLVELGGHDAGSTESLDVEVTTVTSMQGLTDARGPLVVEPVTHLGEMTGIMVAFDGDGRFVPASELALVAAAAGAGIVAHDAKPVVRLFLDAELSPPHVAFDTALAAYLVNPAQRAPDLVDLAHRELGVDIGPTGTEDRGAQGTLDFDALSGPDLEAAARRAVAVSRLVEPLTLQIEARGGSDLLGDIELPLIPILAQMEATGIGVDVPFLRDLSADLRERLGGLELSIHDAAGGPFNVNSTLQLREVLYGRLGLPVLKKTPKGMPSTDASVLQKLRDQHPVVESLLRYRELEKLRSTYVDALIPLVGEDGRVRGRFNQMAAATGRLSQEQPNLQNIPVRSEEGRAIRKAFVAEEGSLFLVADYSQVELRILAHLSGDAGLVEAFEQNRDIHAATAARLAGIEESEVTPDARRKAKVVNFGLLYGMEAFGLAQRLEISREEASEQMDAYFGQFPDVRDFMKGIVEEARATGYTTTLLGRRRYLPELASSSFRNRQMGERMALNAPIQGSAADIIKKAMVTLDAELRLAGSRAEMLLQIHDELVLEVSEDEIDEVTRTTIRVMEGIVDLGVPLKVTTATGRTLADCKA